MPPVSVQHCCQGGRTRLQQSHGTTPHLRLITYNSRTAPCPCKFTGARVYWAADQGLLPVSWVPGPMCAVMHVAVGEQPCCAEL